MKLIYLVFMLQFCIKGVSYKRSFIELSRSKLNNGGGGRYLTLGPADVEIQNIEQVSFSVLLDSNEEPVQFEYEQH